MKAVVFHGVGDVRVEDVPRPRIQDAQDAIVRVTASAICGTDLHIVRGTLNGMKPGTILGHEGIGVVEEIGPGVRNFRPGDRVVIPSSICCGYCSYCRAGYTSQCDNANPQGARAGTAFYGGPADSGAFDGLQAEYARIPFASANLVALPGEITDDQALLLSDVFPTGYFAAKLAEIKPGDTVAVFGCGPIGQFAIASAKLLGAGRIVAVDTITSRLEAARQQGAEIVDFNAEDPVQSILGLTGDIGVDRAIDAVGVDAYRPQTGPAVRRAEQEDVHFKRELDEILGDSRDEHVHPGNAPSQVMVWAIEALAKGGTLSVVGVYPSAELYFPLGQTVEKNLTLRMGNCPHRRYIPTLVDLVRAGAIDPARVLTQSEPITAAPGAYQAFEQRQPGWLKVKLEPALV